MLEKNEIRNIIATLILLLAIVAIYLLPLQIQQETPRSTEQIKLENNLIEQPEINIHKVDSVVTANKPEQIVMRFASESQAEKQGAELTIYNQNLALVKEFRSFPLKKGLNLVRYVDVAALIKPDTVLFTDLTDASAFVVEQNYEYDIANLEKILEKYLDKVITVYAKDGNVFTGRLLSYSHPIVLEHKGKVIALNDVARFEFPELPEGLLTKPTLVWKLYTEKEGIHKTQVSYITEGLTWEASYVAKVNADDSKAELEGWVTIKNNSGTSYENTSLKLIAGKPHIVKPLEQYYRYTYEKATMPTPSPKQFEEEALFEYHMYTLERKTDIKNNETKQISLLKATNIPLKKEYVFEDTGYYYWRENKGGNVKVMVSFDNSEANNLGISLPKGIVRVYKEDSQRKLQFVGEDSIEHTPKDEKVRLFLGYAFDIVAEKKTTSDEKIGEKCSKKSYEVSIRNHKNADIVVNVVQKAYGESKVISSSHDYEKKDAYTFEFKVPVKANSESILTYTIMSCW